MQIWVLLSLFVSARGHRLPGLPAFRPDCLPFLLLYLPRYQVQNFVFTNKLSSKSPGTKECILYACIPVAILKQANYHHGSDPWWRAGGQRGMVTGRNFQGTFSELVFLFLGPDTVTRMCSLQENSLHLCSSLNEQRYTSIKSLLQQKCYRDIWKRLNNYFWTKDVCQMSKRLPTEDIWLNPWCPKRFQNASSFANKWTFPPIIQNHSCS